MGHISQGRGGSKSTKNLLQSGAKPPPPSQMPSQPAGEETEVVVLEGVDIEQFAAMLKLHKAQAGVSDKDLLQASMELYFSMESFLHGMKLMPDSRIGMRFPPSEKIDLTAALLAAKELQTAATDYAFSHPVQREQDAVKRQLAAGLAELTESFLFFAHIEKAEVAMTKERAEVVAGMVVDAKNSLRGLVTQISMLMVPFEG